MRSLAVFLLLILCASCASHRREIFLGSVAAGAVGAGVGYAFVYHGPNRRYEARNTAISSVLFTVLAAGILSWHYRAVDQSREELSSMYSRYRLCDPETDLQGNPSRFLNVSEPKAINRFSVLLDDSTRWVLPRFAKRRLPAERTENQIIPSHEAWQIVQPGYFLSREQDSDEFKKMKQLEIPSRKETSRE